VTPHQPCTGALRANSLRDVPHGPHRRGARPPQAIHSQGANGALASVAGSPLRYLIGYLSSRVQGGFDIVLFLGVLYHLKHPLLALEKICGVTRELCIVDTFVSNQPQFLAGQQTAFPYLEIYERDELGGQLDNWCGPSVEAVLSLVRQAGFASAELLDVRENTARVAAWRTWRNLPEDIEPAVTLKAISSHANRGRSFSSAKEEYLQLWCLWDGQAPPLDAVFPEIGGFGVAPLAASARPEGLLVSVRLPPGLLAGRHVARVKIGAHGWSDPVEFFVDLPPIANELRLLSAQDGISWRDGEVSAGDEGWLTVWVEGLSPEADGGNTTVEIGGIPHLPELVEATTGQVNVKLRIVVRPGMTEVRVRHRGAVSNAVKLRVGKRGSFGQGVRG
jgi:hypothetical protein